jgi:hypothetical protein
VASLWLILPRFLLTSKEDLGIASSRTKHKAVRALIGIRIGFQILAHIVSPSVLQLALSILRTRFRSLVGFEIRYTLRRAVGPHHMHAHLMGALNPRESRYLTSV